MSWKVYSSHSMIKEIREEPEVVKYSVIHEGGNFERVAEILAEKKINVLYMTGCGSSYFTGILGQYFFNEFGKCHSVAVPAFDFIHYTSSILDGESLVIGISQSGETIETVKAIKKAREKNAYVLGLTNNQKSPLAEESDIVILTHAGREVSSGTKTVVAQMTAIYHLALNYAIAKKSYKTSIINEMLLKLKEDVPEAINEMLRELEEYLATLAKKYRNVKDLYIVGAGSCFPTALQASNLIKETSKTHAEGFSVSEFRHGPLELLDDESTMIALNPIGRGYESMLRLLCRVRKIGADIISLAEDRDAQTEDLSTDFIPMPSCFDEWQSSIIYMLPLQLFGYYLAIEKGFNPDHFRNIMKTWRTE